MSSSVIGSTHAPAWLEPVEDPPRRAARTQNRTRERAVSCGDAAGHRPCPASLLAPQTDDTRHVDTAAGVTANAGVPPAHPSLNLSTKDGSVALDQHIRELWHFILIGMFKPLNRVEPVGTYQGLSCHAWFIVGPSNNFQVPKYSRLRLRLPLQVLQVCFVFDVS